MTDPAPGAGHDDSHHEPQDIAAASASSAPTASSPPQAAEDQTSSGHAERIRGGAEPSETTEDDGQSEEGESEEEDEEEESEESEDDDDDDEEPRLKYARLTQHLGGVYKNADATSSFLVAGDKMVVGTHNGNIVGSFAFIGSPTRAWLTLINNSMSSNCLPSNPFESIMRTPPLSQASPCLRTHRP